MIGSAFAPQGNTVAIVSAITSTTAVQVLNAQATVGNALSSLGPSQYMLQCVGAVPMFVNTGTAQSGTAAAAVIPTGGTPANGIPIQPGQRVVLDLSPNCWFTTIASATTSVLYITPGEGGI